MQRNNNSRNEFNLSYLDILTIIDNEKIKIVSVIFISLLFGIFFSLSDKVVKTVELSIFKNSNYLVNDQFNEINIEDEFSIDEQYLFNRFTEQFLLQNNISNILKKNKSLFINSPDHNLKKEESNFQILISREGKMLRAPDAKIIYETNAVTNDVNLKKIFSDVLINIDKQVIFSLQNDFKNHLNDIKNIRDKELRNLRTTRNNLIKDKVNEDKIILVELEENYIIAQRLNLKENLFININSFHNYNPDSIIPSYLAGTIALKSEIDFVKKRIKNINDENAFLYINRVFEIDKEIRNLIQRTDDKIKFISLFFENSVLIKNQDNFNSIIYDLNKIKISNYLFDKYKDIIVFLLIGLLIVSTYIIYISINLIYNTKENTQPVD